MRKNFAPLFIFLLPIFFILRLFAQNLTEVEFIVILRPLLILSLLTFCLYRIFRLFVPDSIKSAIITFILMILFLTYGGVHDFLKSNLIFGFNLSHHRILGVLWAILILLSTILIVVKKKPFNNIVVTFLNITLAILILISSVEIISGLPGKITARNSSSNREVKAQSSWLEDNAQRLEVEANASLPDIYYIIPDMFARNDAIKEFTGYDNSQFISELKDLGFYIAECSRSNYASTQLSITSSLNAHYLDAIQSGMSDRGMLYEPMSNSLVRSSLEEIGYKTVVFNNEFGLQEVRDPDLLISQKQRFFLFRPFSPFENMLVYGSFLRIGYDVNLGFFSTLYDRLFFPYRGYVGAQMNILEELPLLTDIETPKFVFAHIMVPHPPFLFREDGSIETDSDYYREALGQPVTMDLYIEGYRRQIVFIEGRLIEIVEEIINNSDTPPIIIIQGDHGIDRSTRMDILNAFYVPDEVKDKLYPTITPVNTFRVIFNNVFGTQYEPIPDRSWYSVYPNWFEIEIASENNPGCVLKEK